MSSLKRMVTNRRRAQAEQPQSHPQPTPQPAPTNQTTLTPTSSLANNPTNLDIPTAPQTTTKSTSPSSPYRLPHPATPHPADLPTLLAASPRGVTIKKADAERKTLVTALSNARDHQVIHPILTRYLPYALTLSDIAATLSQKGTHITNGITWQSGLTPSPTSFTSGLGLEATMVLVQTALSSLRPVIETHANFAQQPPPTLVSYIRSLQIAAGILAYVRDVAAPAALADFAGTPPPELQPDLAATLLFFALALAQALHVRRAAINGMSPALLAKLSAAAAELAEKAIAKFDDVVNAAIQIAPDLRIAMISLLTLCQGWALQYFARDTPVAEKAGIKVSALAAAIDTLERAGQSPIVGKVAVIDLDALRNELEAAKGDNRIIYQHAIPNREDLQLPPGRSLVNPTPFDAPRVPRHEKSSKPT